MGFIQLRDDGDLNQSEGKWKWMEQENSRCLFEIEMIGLNDGLNVGVEEESGIRLLSGNVRSAIRSTSLKIRREI